ncbi:hypothetical protein D3C71_2110860 [compost metagenome]
MVQMQLCCLVCGFEIVGKGNATAVGLYLTQGAQLFTALGDELVFVLGGGGLDVF